MKHGLRKNGQRERLYRIWDGMIGRCERPSQKGYARYGARGITVCDEWRYNYVAFRTWAYKNGYRDDLTIDRINGDLGYCPENCRWATYKEQVANRKFHRIFYYPDFSNKKDNKKESKVSHRYLPIELLVKPRERKSSSDKKRRKPQGFQGYLPIELLIKPIEKGGNFNK